MTNILIKQKLFWFGQIEEIKHQKKKLLLKPALIRSNVQHKKNKNKKAKSIITLFFSSISGKKKLKNQLKNKKNTNKHKNKMRNKIKNLKQRRKSKRKAIKKHKQLQHR